MMVRREPFCKIPDMPFSTSNSDPSTSILIVCGDGAREFSTKKSPVRTIVSNLES